MLSRNNLYYMEWDNLPMADRAKYIQLGVLSGITSIGDIKDVYNSYASGGYKGDEDNPIMLDGVIVTPQSSALAKSREATAKPNVNFMNAQDMKWWQSIGATILPITKWGRKVVNPKTCVNTVTGFYDSKNTVASNVELTYRPEQYGYKEIPQSEAIPGDIIMLHNKDNYPHHAVMFDSVSDKEGNTFDNYQIEIGDTLVNYSNGGRGKENYRLQQPLSKFLEPDSGGDFTGIHRYFRYTGKKKKR